MAIDVRGVCTLVLVFDMPTSLKFYRDVLGFQVVATNDDDAGDNVDWCYLRLGKTELMLNGMYEAHERPTAPDKKRIATHSDVCLYFGCPDVDGAYRYLRSKGVARAPIAETRTCGNATKRAALGRCPIGCRRAITPT